MGNLVSCRRDRTIITRKVRKKGAGQGWGGMVLPDSFFPSHGKLKSRAYGKGKPGKICLDKALSPVL